MRNGADLLDGAVHQLARIRCRLPHGRRRILGEDSVQDHLGRSEFLSQAIVNFAGDPAPLLVLQGHQAAGKPPEFRRPDVHHPFQFDRVVANRLFEHLAVMDVGTSPIPLEDAPFRISKRNGAGAEPAVLPVGAAQTVFRFIISPRTARMQPVRQASLLVVGMQIFQPAESDRGTRRQRRCIRKIGR